MKMDFAVGIGRNGRFALCSGVRTMWLSKQKGPEIEDLRRSLERNHPGLIDQYQRVYAAWARTG